MRTAALTALAMCGFAGNSLLCRAALAGEAIDPASFTAVRLASGALVLALIAGPRTTLRSGSGRGALLLFTYAATFSFAYVSLPAGTGALLLFGSVQVTMIGWSVLRGERPGPRVWAGAAMAVAGLLVLALPGATAPAPIAAALMVAAGGAWGGYSLLGARHAGKVSADARSGPEAASGRRGTADPLLATAGNFVRAAPLAIPLLAVPAALGVTPRGLVLAVASGAIASGLIYAVWYAALPHLRGATAALVQLSVPVIAAGGGILLLGESFTTALGAAAALILGGIALAVSSRSRGAATDRTAPASGGTGPGRTA